MLAYGGTVAQTILPKEEQKDASATLERLVKVGANWVSDELPPSTCLFA